MFHKEGYKIIFIATLSFIAGLLLTNKFISETNCYGIDNIYIGSIKTQYKLIKHFHENLDNIVKANSRRNEQEFLVFSENAKLFPV
mgnify:CR=1 FL=1